MTGFIQPTAALGLLGAGLAFGAQAAEIPKSPEVAQSGALTIANTLDYAPFEYLDADGKQAGIIVELAGEVASGSARSSIFSARHSPR